MEELTPKQKRIVDIIEEGEVGLLKYLVEVDEKLDEALPSINGLIKKVKGEKGNDGKDGVDGRDGRDGKNYILTNLDKKSIAKSITVPVVEKVIEKTQVIRETPIVTEVVKQVAVKDTPDELIAKIESITDEDKKLSSEAIRGLKSYDDEIATLQNRTQLLNQLVGGLSNTSSGGTGDVVGPASAADSNFASFNTTTGKLIKDSTYSSASFATSAQGALADSAIQSGANISVFTNDSGFTTNTGTVTSVATGTGLTGGPITGTGTVSLNAGSISSLALADSALQSSNIGVSVQGYSSVLANTTASFLTAQETKLGHISVTQAVDLDQMETDIAALANGMVYKGNWDASAGTFPGSNLAQTGWFYTVSVGGTVDSVVFAVDDRLVATVDNASSTTYATNWTKLDATDAVQSVNSQVGSVVLDADDISDATTTNKFTTAGDISKLAGIEALADVTDTTNVTSAGALMDSEVTNLSGIKTLTVPDSTTITVASATVLDDATVGDMVNTLGGATSTGTGGLVRETSPTLSGPTFSGQQSGATGSATEPSYSFTSDLNTGMWRATADTLCFSTGGTERFRMSGNGNMSIGSTNSGYRLDVTTATNKSMRVYAAVAGSDGVPAGALNLGAILSLTRPSDGANGILGFFVLNNNDLGIRARGATHFYGNTTETVTFKEDGKVGIGTDTPTGLFDVNSDTIRIRNSKTPASAGATGNQGDIAWDSSYIYICTATNTWKRVAIATW